MKIPFLHEYQKSKRQKIASQWVMETDAGLSPARQDELHDWLAADPRNREAFLEFTSVWGEFDRLAGLEDVMPRPLDQDILKPVKVNRKLRRRRMTLIFGTALAVCLALAAALMLGTIEREVGSESAVQYLDRIEQLTFEDGSTCELKRGSEIQVVYSDDERRIRLLRGEAVFTVEKDHDRPFRVEVDGIQVEAIGTVFNVRDGSHEVDVIVTEGRVELNHAPGVGLSGAIPPRDLEAPTVETFEKASISKLRGVATAEITSLDPTEVEEALIWRPQRLEFMDTPLSVIVSEFNRRNEIQIVLGSADLSSLRITSFFWSDDVGAFVRLLEHGFNTRVIWSDQNKIVIDRSK